MAMTRGRRAAATLRAALLTGSLAGVVQACGGARDAQQEPGTAGDTPAAGAAADAAVCTQAPEYAAAGAVPVHGETAPGNAAQVTALRWQAHDGCERLVIDLATAGGAPADAAGDVRAEFLPDLGIIRITLRNVDAVAEDATDAIFDGAIASRAWTVRSAEGQWLFVDVHLNADADAAVTLLREPGRVVLDLILGDDPMPPPAAVEQRVVVITPRPGTVRFPFTVEGYARTFEANVVIRIEQNGRTIGEEFTTASSYIETWGAFSHTVRTGPAGAFTLHAGEYSARDGAWEGIRMELYGER